MVPSSAREKATQKMEAPAMATRRLDSEVFRARTVEEYLGAFGRAGLRCRRVVGVDPAPFRRWLLVHYRGLPRPLQHLGAGLATVLSVPLDLEIGLGLRCVVFPGRKRQRRRKPGSAANASGSEFLLWPGAAVSCMIPKA